MLKVCYVPATSALLIAFFSSFFAATINSTNEASKQGSRYAPFSSLFTKMSMPRYKHERKYENKKEFKRLKDRYENNNWSWVRRVICNRWQKWQLWLTKSFLMNSHFNKASYYIFQVCHKLQKEKDGNQGKPSGNGNLMKNHHIPSVAFCGDTVGRAIG